MPLSSHADDESEANDNPDEYGMQASSSDDESAEFEEHSLCEEKASTSLDTPVVGEPVVKGKGNLPSTPVTCGPKMSQTFANGYKQLECQVERGLLALFRNIKDDENETVILFLCGIMAGGALNTHMSAFGLMYGMSILQPRSLCTLKAVVSTILFWDTFFNGRAYGVMTCAHLGLTLQRFSSDNSISPTLSAHMTLCGIALLTHSFATAVIIWLIHIRDAYEHLVQRVVVS